MADETPNNNKPQNKPEADNLDEALNKALGSDGDNNDGAPAQTESSEANDGAEEAEIINDDDTGDGAEVPAQETPEPPATEQGVAMRESGGGNLPAQEYEIVHIEDLSLKLTGVVNEKMKAIGAPTVKLFVLLQGEDQPLTIRVATYSPLFQQPENEELKDMVTDIVNDFMSNYILVDTESGTEFSPARYAQMFRQHGHAVHELSAVDSDIEFVNARRMDEFVRQAVNTFKMERLAEVPLIDNILIEGLYVADPKKLEIHIYLQDYDVKLYENRPTLKALADQMRNALKLHGYEAWQAVKVFFKPA